MEQTEKLFTLFQDIKNEHNSKKLQTLNSNILIVDFLNLFIRAFSASPSMNDDGAHVGGISGALYSLGNAIKITGATRCIIVSDGENSAQRKRSIYPEYKQKRRMKVNLNRAYEFHTEDEEKESMKYQMLRLFQYLKCMPVQVFSIDAIEADDVIAYLTNEVFTDENSNITIMSSDKDFLQLITDRIKVWSPTKKKLYDKNRVLEEYKISATNFLLYRVLIGDSSDNIDGVDGCGKVIVPKKLPILSENIKHTISDLIKYSEEKSAEQKNIKFYSNILNSKDKLVLNEKLMQLEYPDMPAHAKLKIFEYINKPIPTLNKYEIHMMYIHDKISSAMKNINEWLLSTFSVLNAFAINSEIVKKNV